MLALYFILLLHSLPSFSSAPIDSIIQNISIQTTNETFYSYIPLSSDCTYPNQSSVQLGHLQYTPLDPPAIFNSVSLTAQVTFWGPLVNGLRMQLNADQLLSNGTYSQVVLYNSSINQNFTQRELILTSFSPLGEIIFNYANPIYNYTANTLTPASTSKSTFDLGKKISKIVRDCSESGNFIWITYAGEGNFVGVCPNTSNLFVWNVNNNTEPYVYDQLSFLEGSNIQNITNDPTLFFPIVPNNTIPLPKNKNYDWNIVLLLQGGTSAFFCQANSTALLCESYQNQQNWVQIVIQREWGLQASLELSQIQLILTQFPQLLNQTFPGNIVSIFSYSNTLFIESSSYGTTYLCIFQSSQILANTSLTGQIIYYGRENLIIQQQNGSFFMVDFILPMYQIVHQDPQQQNQTLNISCTFTTYQLVYDIVWSNIAFPMYLVQQLSTIPTVSYQSVKAANLDDFFMIIGPAFNIFIELDAGIDINLLDISELLGVDQILDVVSVLFTEGNGQAYVPYIINFLDERGILKQYRIGSHLPALSLGQPCGMGKVDQCFNLKNGFIFTSGEAICYCDKNIKNCHTLSPESLPGIVSQQTSSLGEYSITLSSIIDQISPLSPSSTLDAGSPIKKQLLAIVNQDLIINIYQNNTITLTNFRGQLKDSLSPICLQYNTTDGTIFIRNFYDDYLLVYCYGRSTISQYLIRNQQLIFNRVVPLYGFLTTNSSSGILPGENYVFLQVKLNPEYFGTIKPKANSTSCCILRLDPDQFTVSVMAEIIMGTKLITVQSMYGVDVVFYNSTEVEGAVPMIKVYFDSSWITFSQNTRCTPQNITCTPMTYPYSIALISDFYNFAAAFNLFIIFNISASVINFTGVGIHDISLEMYTGKYIFYNSSVNYSFNSFCGPISSFHQKNIISETGSIFLITENDIITESKELTNNYQPILQVIDLGEEAPGTTLGGSIIMVGIKNLSFYLKYNLTWMSELTVIDSPQPNCLYFVNKILNQTAVQLGSDCYNPNVNTPTITINYPNKTSTPTVSFGQMQMPMQLRNVVSVLQLNQTLLIGIQQGPSKSVSGVLFLCNISICNPLTIESRVVFFIDFDQQLTSNGLIIIGLDVYIVSIWVNPILTSNSSAIQTNHTINYYNQLGYSCSKVKIVSASPTSANVILSCPSGLQQVILDYGPKSSPSISRVMTFTKFANCEAIDRFKPQFILEQGTTTSIQFLAVQCQQNVDIVRIQEIYSLNSNNSLPIVTGYLMIYTNNGPQCSPNVWNPVRMINLGTSQESSPYNIYYANGQYKLLYGQINGILIDSFISTQPNTYYELIKLTQHINYPSILMSVKNPYYEIKLMIDTAPQKIPTPPVVRYLIIAIFVFFNVTTIIFLFCWCLFRKHVSRHRNRLFETSIDPKIIINSPSRLNPSHFVSDQDSIYSSEYRKAETGGAQMEQRASVLRPSNVNNQRKRKGTEIQLFQPR